MDVTPELIAELSGARTTEWRVDLLDGEDQFVRTLTEFQGGSLEQNLFRPIRGGGSLQLVSPPGSRGFDIDWGVARFAPVQVVNGLEIPWGIYLPEMPSTGYNDEALFASGQVSLMDKLLVLDQDGPEHTYSVAEGESPTDRIREIFGLVGEERVIVQDSTLQVPNARLYDVDATWLEIINDLCSIINYWSVFCDDQGYYRVEPYRDPASRPSLYTFASGEASLYVPDWEEEQDWFSVPNRVVLRSKGDEDEEGVEASAENTNPDSPFSIPRRGRVIRHVETGVEAADEVVLQELAKRRLDALTGKVTNAYVSHAPIPFWPNDRLDFRSPSKDSVLRLTLTQWKVNMTAGSLMDSRFRGLL